MAGGALAYFAPCLRDIFASAEHRRLTDARFAEEFTSSQLRPLRLHGWKQLDRVEFHSRDVDHVIVGPGGVYVIETKNTNVAWSIEGHSFSNQWAIDAVAQSRRNADHIRALLTQKLKATYDVRPLLVIWGDGRPNLDNPINVDRGVVVVTGRLLRKHLKAQPALLTSSEVDRIARQLHHFVKGKKAFDRAAGKAST